MKSILHNFAHDFCTDTWPLLVKLFPQARLAVLFSPLCCLISRDYRSYFATTTRHTHRVQLGYRIQVTFSTAKGRSRFGEVRWCSLNDLNAVKYTCAKLRDRCSKGSRKAIGIIDHLVPQHPPFQSTPTRLAYSHGCARKVEEAIYIKLHPNNNNRQGLQIQVLWMPTTTKPLEQRMPEGTTGEPEQWRLKCTNHSQPSCYDYIS